MCFKTSCSRDLVITGMSALGWKLLRLFVDYFLGTGMIKVDFECEKKVFSSFVNACSDPQLCWTAP